MPIANKANLPMVSCPFNPIHRVQAEFLQTHIIRCQKNYPNHVTCPYNALHKFLTDEELLQHLYSCTSKKLINQIVFGRTGNFEDPGDLTEQPFYFKVLSSTAWQDEEW